MRAGVADPSETRFVDSAGEWIMAHQVVLDQPWRGLRKLVKMAELAITECLETIPAKDWSKIPLLLCVAESRRPGRIDDLNSELFSEIQKTLGVEFADDSLVIPQGRVSFGIALKRARELIARRRYPWVLIAASDSLVNWPTLQVYERATRLLTADNSNGFIPGEGAAALLVGTGDVGPHLWCTGLGRTTEVAHIDSGQPLRGEGLTRAIKQALSEAGCELQQLDFRITDLSGEQYYFKEAALAVARILRAQKEEFDIWHPAECVGELGSVAGLVAVAVADMACRKSYGKGPQILCHASGDSGERAAAIFCYGPA
jgi:3-oxoacyl-[acyl-carrier-protein] synthase-1